MLSSKVLRMVLASVSLTCFAAGAQAQGTWYVDDDASSGGDGTSWATANDSLSTALTAAQPGDQIWVAAGTYVGNFTLALGVEVYGGFAGTETELTQRDWEANPTILDGNRRGSVVTSPPGATDTTRIDGFTITNGSAGWGGGLYLDSSSPTIANNTITGNDAYHGGGLYLEDSSPTIANNTIMANIATYGGGLSLDYSSPTIASNTITGNGAREGGGLYLEESSPTMANTVVAFNSSGIYRHPDESAPTLRCNCVYGNTHYGYSGLDDPTGTDGNISTDPRLAGPQYGNVHIQPDSPCVDTGSNGDAFGDFDMDGEPRIQGGTVDIGADESDGTVWPPGPYVVVRVNLAGDDANDGSSWGLAKRTVQAGIDAASALGGEVWVQAGTYYECVTLPPYVYLYGGFAGGETTRDQRDWDANVSTLDGQQERSVVTGRAGYGAVGAIDGFTITNGSAVYGGGLALRYSSPTIANNTITANSAFKDGGGLYLYESSATIASNTITGNGASESGGGLYMEGSSPTIANNTITGNSARWCGGLHLDSSSPTIANNTITGNSADITGGGLCLTRSSSTIAYNTITGNSATYYGGGVYLSHSSPPTIANNTITGNGAYHGGGLYLDFSSPTIANNTITGNDALNGGGLCLHYSSPTIVNNTMTANSASYDGGGLYLYYYSSPTIANTIVAFNSSGIYRYDTASTPTLRHNCVFGNTAYDYSGLTDPTGIDGNISADPRLADPQYGNVHIQPDSPCVDAGSNYDASGDFDVDGEPRIQPLGGRVDIGADESDGTAWAAGPYVIVRVSPVGDDANDGSSWALAKRTVQAGIYAASALGGEVWVQADTYQERITLHAYAYVYGGFAGAETARDERDWGVNVTALDGQQQGSVVTGRTGYGAVGAIDGFTVTNGSAEYGGGLYLYYSSPTIRNNTITGNSADKEGGGLCLEGSAPTIANNRITGNDAYDGGGLYLDSSSPTIANNTITGNGAYAGGGLYLYSSSPVIANNTIMANIATYGGSGGGLYLRDSAPMIADNTITGNSAKYGGGLYLRDSAPTIANNTITGNKGLMHGGGLCLSSSSPMIANNTITGNRAYYDGGGLFLSVYCSPTIANTIVAFNSSGLYLSRYDGTPRLRYNCVYGNAAYDYQGLIDPTGTDGNISAAPLFAQDPNPGLDGLWGTQDDDLGDLRLLSGSPCIDAGDNDGVPPDTPDLDGDSDTEEPLPFDLAGGPRFLDDPQTPDTGNGLPPIVDMGAYEFHPPIVIAAHLDIKPGSCPNPVNPRSQGVLPVALIGSELFEVTQVDVDSMALARADGVGGSVTPLTGPRGPLPRVADAGTAFVGEPCECHDIGPDGIDDLVLKFSTPVLVETLELGSLPRGTSVMLTLSGSLLDGTEFEASDCIVIVGKYVPGTLRGGRKPR